VRELVVILSDVYGLPDALPTAAPALEEVRRYGRAQALPGGWRPWVARRIGRDDLAELAPAVVAATLIPSRSAVEGREGTPTGDCWLVTPVHLQAAMDHVRLGSGGLLTVSEEEAGGLAAEFSRVFAGSGLRLEPLPPTGWLLVGMTGEPAETSDPACALGGDIAPCAPRGAGARALRALGTEIEMWLHGHALNRERVARGRAPISQLWIWGGGGGSGAAETRPQPLAHGFGRDLWLRGLWRACGGCLASGARGELASSVAARSDAAGAALVDHLFECQLFGEGSEFAGLGDFDARALAPALEALRVGRVQRLFVLCGDQAYRLARSDLWKFWRRPRASRGLPA